jgi:hypothetical protein
VEKSFTAFMRERGACSKAQLAEATQAMVVFGGRLGTALVELGYLAIEDVERHLSDYLGVPVAPAAWLAAPAPEALAAVPKPLVEKYRVLPLRLEGRVLHAALLDPRHPAALADLGFATDLAIRAYVAAELRLSALLEHHYGIPREVRFIEVEGRGLARDPAEAQRAAGGDPAEQPGPELIDEETFASLHSEWNRAAHGRGAGPAAAPAPAPAEAASAPSGEPAAADAAALEAQLLAAPDRDAVADLALRLARQYADAAALFSVRGGFVSGTRGDGAGIPERLDGVMLPLAAESAFARVAAGGGAFRGAPSGASLDRRLLAALARSEAREICLLPIAIGPRVVNVLYADAGARPLGETRAAALAALGALVSRAYARLILAKKHKLEAGAA